ERSFGNATGAAPNHRQVCRRKSLIQRTIKVDTAKARFRCFVRKRAICWSTNAAKWSKAKRTNDRSGETRRDDGRPADRKRRGRDFWRANCRCWKISGRLSAICERGDYRSWRASAAARANQRALSPRLYLPARQNFAPEIVSGLDRRYQCGESEAFAGRLCSLDSRRVR